MLRLAGSLKACEVHWFWI